MIIKTVLTKDLFLHPLVSLDKFQADALADLLGTRWNPESKAPDSESFIVQVHLHQTDEDINTSQSGLFADPNDKSKDYYPHLHILWAKKLVDKKGPRWTRIMDGSIWNYCLPESGLDTIPKGYWEELEWILEEIYRNYSLHLYELGSSLEFADLNARLGENAFFRGGHHSSKVSPFLFHSEYHTYQALIGERLNNYHDKGNAFCFGKKWRFLLVDDHAGSPLSKRWESGAPDSFPSKMDVIVERFRHKGIPVKLAYRKPGKDWEGDTEDFDIAIDSVTTVADLVASLFGPEKKRYDIILLDYLLGAGQGSRGERAEYSYAFFYVLKSLRDILEIPVEKDTVLDGDLLGRIQGIVDRCEAMPIGNEAPLAIKPGNIFSIYGRAEFEFDSLNKLQDWIKDGIGPKQRLYFMYISSFVHAIQERLEAQRISRAEKYWYIGRGSCPVNTPELFLFNLNVIMEKRYNKIVDLQDGSRFQGVPAFLDRIFSCESTQEVKTQCRKCFSQLLQFSADFTALQKDIHQEDKSDLDGFSSVLLKSIYKDSERFTVAFWAHLQHFCYLVSYGTDRQKPELWEEYLYLRPYLTGAAESGELVEKMQRFIQKL